MCSSAIAMRCAANGAAAGLAGFGVPVMRLPALTPCVSQPVPAGECGMELCGMLKKAHDTLQRKCEENTAEYKQLVDEGKVLPEAVPHGSHHASGRGEVPASEKLTPFHSRNLPPLSLMQLAEVMKKATKTDDKLLWIALALFMRYCEYSEIAPSKHLMHRLYVTCLHLAIKTHDDRFFSNGHYARLAGVSPPEMNNLEVALLNGCNWRSLVTSDHVAAITLDPDHFVDPLPTPKPHEVESVLHHHAKYDAMHHHHAWESPEPVTPDQSLVDDSSHDSSSFDDDDVMPRDGRASRASLSP